MSRSTRTVVFAVGAAGFLALFIVALLPLHTYAPLPHPYAERAVESALQMRHTANTVASVTFDLRGLDSLGEEFILFAAILGVSVLLRRNPDERIQRPDDGEDERPRVLDVLRLTAYLMLPVTAVVGFSVVIHGHLTPGGGFQGGVVLATGIHLLYLAGDYPSLQRLRPMVVFEASEAIGVASFVLVGLAAMATGAIFLTNVLPYGTLGSLTSAGVVPIINVLVAAAVGSGMVLLLARFLEQALLIREERPADDPVRAEEARR